MVDGFISLASRSSHVHQFDDLRLAAAAALAALGVRLITRVPFTQFAARLCVMTPPILLTNMSRQRVAVVVTASNFGIMITQCCVKPTSEAFALHYVHNLSARHSWWLAAAMTAAAVTLDAMIMQDC